MKINWLVDTCLMTDDENQRLRKALSNDNVHVSSYKPFIDEVNTFNLTNRDPVAVYGSIQFARKTNHFYGNLLIEKDYLVTNYRETIGILENEYWLNNGMFCTWGHLKRSLYSILPNCSSIFIRPNSGVKTFNGFVIHREQYKCIDTIRSIQAAEAWKDIDPTCLVQVSKAERIKAEYRMFIYDRKVITGSLYGGGKTSPIIDPTAQSFAEKVAKLATWKVPFVLDVAILEDGEPKIVEVNCITCAGWYDADYDKIVKCVNDYTWMTYKEEKKCECV